MTGMSFLCDHCEGLLAASHAWVGMTVVCPSCAQTTKIGYRDGQLVEQTGYAITYADFVQLLSYGPYRPKVAPEMRRLVGCAIDDRDGRAVLVLPDGSLMPDEVAHLAIQGDSSKQRTLYGVAMGLWR